MNIECARYDTNEFLKSNRLLNTLTQALQSSGVDLSKASISVQIDLGNKANSRTTAPTSIIKVFLPFTLFGLKPGGAVEHQF